MGKLLRLLGAVSLERRIFLVAAASLLPLAVLFSITLFDAAKEQKARLLDAHLQNARTLAAAVDSQFENVISALDAYASNPLLAQEDFAGLRQTSLQLLARQPTWLNVVIATPQGQQVMNARVGTGDLRTQLAPDFVREVAGSGRPAISDLVRSETLQREVLAVHVPVEISGQVRFVVTAVIAPESLSNLVMLHPVAEGGVVTIADRNHRVVARSRDIDQWLGRSATGPLLERLQAGDADGMLAAATLDGAAVYSAYHRSEFSGWTVVVGLPRHVIDAPLRWTSLEFGASIVVSVLLGLLVASRVGRTIVSPMRELESSAASVGRGEAPLMPQTGLLEVRRVGQALVSAHVERQHALERERDARQVAESASRAKDEFLAMLGHELRNPLAAITTAARLLEQGRDGLPPSQANAAAIVSRQARHLARMTDDLLDAGRVALGKVVLSRSRMNLAHSVETAMASLRNSRQLVYHDVSVRAEEVWIDGDATRIDQIILNLVTNAIKYTPQGGSIRVEAFRAGPEAVLRVNDTGIGLEPQLQAHVFDLFVQGEQTMDRSQGGLGIGLTLVRRLAELHGGSAEVESPGPGRGATFTVRLPAADPGVAPPAPGRRHAVTPLRIALVEDNEDVRTGLRHLLELDGHTVLEAADGQSGLQLVLSEPQLDAAFIDIGLPGMDGLQLARTVRQAGGRRELLLVAITGYGAERDRARGMEAGFDAYLVKPIDQDALRSLLEKKR